MIDREALAAALDRFAANWQSGDFKIIAVAASERLAQLPKECENCGGDGYFGGVRGCPTCRGSGKVSPAGLVLVEKVDSEWPKWAKVVIHKWFQGDKGEHPATELLDALNRSDTPLLAEGGA